jgi:hypothetical protein
MSLGSEREDAAAGGFGEHEVRLVVVANIGVVGNLARRLIVGVAVGLNRDRIVLRAGVREIKGEGDDCGLGGDAERDEQEGREEESKRMLGPGQSLGRSGFQLVLGSHRLDPKIMPKIEGKLAD